MNFETIGLDQETDETDNNETTNKNVVVVLGEAPESDEEEYIQTETEKDNENDSDLNNSQHSKSQDEDKLNLDDKNKYNSLLHYKLREKNEQLKNELVGMACHPYNSATRGISNITKDVIQTQKTIQGISVILRKTSKELFLLEDNIDTITKNKSLLSINFIGTNETSTPGESEV